LLASFQFNPNTANSFVADFMSLGMYKQENQRDYYLINQ